MINKCLSIFCLTSKNEPALEDNKIAWNDLELSLFKKHIRSKEGNRFSEIWFFYEQAKINKEIAINNTLFKILALESFVSKLEHLDEIFNMNLSTVRTYFRSDPLLEHNTECFIKILEGVVERAFFYKNCREIRNLKKKKELYKKIDIEENILAAKGFKQALDKLDMDYFKPKLEIIQSSDSIVEVNTKDIDEKLKALTHIRYTSFLLLVKLNAIGFTLLSSKSPIMSPENLQFLFINMNEINIKTQSLFSKILLGFDPLPQTGEIPLEKLWIDEKLIEALAKIYKLRTEKNESNESLFELYHCILDEGLRMLVKLRGVKNKNYFQDFEKFVFNNAKEKFESEQKLKKSKSNGLLVPALGAQKDRKRRKRRKKSKSRRFGKTKKEKSEEEINEGEEDDLLERILAESDDAESFLKSKHDLSTIRELTASNEQTEIDSKGHYDIPEFKGIYSPMINKPKAEPSKTKYILKGLSLTREGTDEVKTENQNFEKAASETK